MKMSLLSITDSYTLYCILNFSMKEKEKKILLQLILSYFLTIYLEYYLSRISYEA